MKKNDTLLLLLVGIGIYFYLKSKKTTATPDVISTNPVLPTNDTGVPIAQSLDSNNMGPEYHARFALSGMNKHKFGNIPNTI
jgi:hypothetical protein